MERNILLGLGVLLLSVAVLAEDGEAKLILIKDIGNKIITEGNDLSIEYNLYNIGESAATEVELADSTFHESDFELVSGMTSVKWERVPSGANVTHVVVVRPLKSSAFNFTSAVVQYVASDGADPTFGFSNDLGELEILSLKEYNRLYASHIPPFTVKTTMGFAHAQMEWTLFAVWCCPSLLLPFSLFSLSKSKYTKTKKN